MTTVGDLWRGLTDLQRERAATALRASLHETGIRIAAALNRDARTAPAVEPAADASPYLFPAEPAPAPAAVRCYDCGTEVVVDPYWYLLDDGRIVQLGSTCYRDRLLHVAKKAGGRHEALTLPLDREAL